MGQEGWDFFKNYIREFKGREIPYEIVEQDQDFGKTRIRLKRKDAMEFLYTYTWGPRSFPYEVREQYGVLTRKQYEAMILEIAKELGMELSVVELPPEEQSYLQEGYPKNLNGKAKLFDLNGNEVKLPDSNMMMVFEKRSEVNDEKDLAMATVQGYQGIQMQDSGNLDSGFTENAHNDSSPMKRPDQNPEYVRNVARMFFVKTDVPLTVPRDLKGANIAIINPGRNANEIIAFVKEFPGINTITIIDEHDSVFTSINDELTNYHAKGNYLPKINGYNVSVLGMPQGLSGLFDLVFSHYVMDHFSPDMQRRAAEEMQRIVKPGGAVVISGVWKDGNWFKKLSPRGLKVYSLTEDIVFPMWMGVKSPDRAMRALVNPLRKEYLAMLLSQSGRRLDLERLKPHLMFITDNKSIYRDPVDPKRYYIVLQTYFFRLAELTILKAIEDIRKNQGLPPIPGIPRVLEWGIQNKLGSIWMHLEGIENSTSLDISQIWENFDIEHRLKILADVADVLETVHRMGISFNDVKPTNITINDQGKILIIDWEFACPLGKMNLGETQGYWSPEIIKNERSDVYSLGIVIKKEIIEKFFKDKGVNQNILVLVNEMTNKDYRKRPFMKDVSARLRAIALEPDLAQKPEDHAMKLGIERKGGIDLTPANLNLEVKKGINSAFEGIRLHLDPAMLQQLQNAPGFVPVIINIRPLNDLKAFLGVDV